MKRREVKTCKHWQDESLHGFLGKWHSCISSSAEFLQQHPASVCFPVWLLAAVGGVCVQPQGKRGYFTLLSASQHSFSWERWVQPSKHVYPRFWGGYFYHRVIDNINSYRLYQLLSIIILYRIIYILSSFTRKSKHLLSCGRKHSFMNSVAACLHFSQVKRIDFDEGGLFFFFYNNISKKTIPSAGWIPLEDIEEPILHILFLWKLMHFARGGVREE